MRISHRKVSFTICLLAHEQFHPLRTHKYATVSGWVVRNSGPNMPTGLCCSTVYGNRTFREVRTRGRTQQMERQQWRCCRWTKRRQQQQQQQRRRWRVSDRQQPATAVAVATAAGTAVVRPTGPVTGGWQTEQPAITEPGCTPSYQSGLVGQFRICKQIWPAVVTRWTG